MATQDTSIAPIPSAEVPVSSDDWRHRPAASGWRYHYLVARSRYDEDTAVRYARVSVPIVTRERQISPDFDSLRQAAIEHRLGLGNEDSYHLARQAFPALLQHAISRATSPEVRDRDQLGWAKLTGDVAGATQPAVTIVTGPSLYSMMRAELQARLGMNRLPSLADLEAADTGVDDNQAQLRQPVIDGQVTDTENKT